MIQLINIVTTFSALEVRKVKAIHFNRIHKIIIFAFKMLSKAIPCPKECCYLMN